MAGEGKDPGLSVTGDQLMAVVGTMSKQLKAQYDIGTAVQEWLDRHPVAGLDPLVADYGLTDAQASTLREAVEAIANGKAAAVTSNPAVQRCYGLGV